MKRLLAMLLTIVMILSVFSACGSQPAASSKAAEDVTEVLMEENPTDEPENAADEEDFEEMSAEEAEAEEEAQFEVMAPLTYPLADGTPTFTIMHAEPMLGPMSGQMAMEDYGDFDTIAEATAYIGVTPEWIPMSQMTGETQFNLVVASGDYPDVFTAVDKYYSGGFPKAYEDEVITAIDDYLAEGMPEYWNLIHEDPDLLRAVTGDDGSYYAWYSVFDKIVVNEGYFIRKDWCDALGMDIPTTMDEINDFAYGARDKFDLDTVILMGEGLDTLASAYGVGGTVTSGSGFAYHREGDAIVADITSPRYKDFVTQLRQWYVDEIVPRNFSELDTSNMSGVMEQQLYDNKTGIVTTMVNSMDNLTNPDEGFELAAMVVTVDGDNIHTGSGDRQFDSSCISSNCDPEKIPYILGWMNYWYTDEGAMAMCYGVKGLDYDLDAEGNPYYLENITENAYGYPPMLFSRARCFSGASFGLMYEDRTRPFFTEKQEAAIDVWTSRTDSRDTVPGALGLNTEESEIVALYATDLATYISEEVPKFVTGDRDLSEWDSFVEICESMHVAELTEAYQNAFDRYLAK